MDKRQLAQAINDMAGVFSDPVIVHRCGWMDMVPKWIFAQITVERLLHLMRHKDYYTGKKDYEHRHAAEMATDAEALAYMVPASLEFPLDHEWSQIYFYITTKVYEQANQGKMPDDIRCDVIDKHLMAQLCDLKHWIWGKKMAARKDRAKLGKKNKPQIVAVDKPEDTQISLFK